MRMLRRTLGKTKRDRIRNDTIREMAGVTEVSRKIQERSLQWFGHLMRIEENHVVKIVSRMQVEGRRARPKRRCRDCVVEDIREKGLTEEDVQDWSEWRRRARNSDPLPQETS